MVDIVDDIVLVGTDAEVVLRHLDVLALAGVGGDLILRHLVFKLQTLGFLAQTLRLILGNLACRAHGTREAENTQHILRHRLLAQRSEDDRTGQGRLGVFDFKLKLELGVFRRDRFLEGGFRVLLGKASHKDRGGSCACCVERNVELLPCLELYELSRDTRLLGDVVRALFIKLDNARTD